MSIHGLPRSSIIVKLFGTRLCQCSVYFIEMCLESLDAVASANRLRTSGYEAPDLDVAAGFLGHMLNRMYIFVFAIRKVGRRRRSPTDLDVKNVLVAATKWCVGLRRGAAS